MDNITVKKEEKQKTVKDKKISFSGAALLAPVPVVIVTSGTMEKPCAITIGWTGMLASDPPKTYISVRKERNSYNIIKESGEFVINLVNKRLTCAADYCGVKSGRNTDKFADMFLETTVGEKTNCPTLDASPLSLECKVSDILPMGSHDVFIADIVGVNLDQKYFSGGKICLDRAFLVSYCHGEYFLLGEKLGQFGYSVAKKKRKDAAISRANTPTKKKK